MLLHGEYISDALGYPAHFDLSVPDRTLREDSPVLWLLHGGDGTSWLHNSGVQHLSDKYGIIVIMPQDNSHCWRDAAVTFPGMPLEPDKCVHMEKFMMEELPAKIDQIFHLRLSERRNYIAGLSLGGYGSAFYAANYPDHFDGVGLFSPYLFTPKAFTVDRAALSKEDLIELMHPELILPLKENCGKLPAYFMMNGTKDVLEFAPVYADLLREAGADVETCFDTYEYGHEWPFWELCLPLFMKWIDDKQ